MTIKPHSVFRALFSDKELVADFDTYQDIIFYLNSMQPAFINYLTLQKENSIQESYVFLDKNLREIQLDELSIRRARDGDIIHIVPAIIGGGGKRGIFAILAVAAFAFAIVATGGAAAAAGAASPIGATVAGAGGLGGVLAGLAGSPMISNLAINIGLAVLSSLFAPKPKAAESTRENDAFGSLVNSTNSGTPVALHYGLVRVAGQLVSGYISTVNHAKNEQVDVYGDIYGDTETVSSTGVVTITSRIHERPD